jgi:hypothetical protein
MSEARCPRCSQPVSFMTQAFASSTQGLCPTCRRQLKQESQAANLDELRRLEDKLFGFLLAPVPAKLRPGLTQVLSKPRVRGLTKLVGGLGLGALTYLLTAWLAKVSGVAVVNGFVVVPLAVALVGWIELNLGISFADLATRFDRSGFFLKLGIMILVLLLVGLFIGTAIWIYRKYM